MRKNGKLSGVIIIGNYFVRKSETWFGISIQSFCLWIKHDKKLRLVIYDIKAYSKDTVILKIE